MKTLFKPLAIATLGLVAAAAATTAQAVDVKVTLTQLSPAGGVGIAPLWVGFHNSSFDAFDVGSAASLGIERAAEDGSAAQLSTIFAATVSGGVQGTLPGPPAFSGAVRNLTLTNVDLAGVNRYFSYAAIVVLSNDFFIGNDNAKEHDLAGIVGGGHVSFLVGGLGDVYDAGTEVNDFRYSLANGAYGFGGGQTGPNQGNDEHGFVHVVTGNPYTSFLSQNLVPQGYQYGALDFNASPAFARIDIEVLAAPVPEPQTYGLMLAGLAVIGWLARRRGVST